MMSNNKDNRFVHVYPSKKIGYSVVSFSRFDKLKRRVHRFYEITPARLNSILAITDCKMGKAVNAIDENIVCYFFAES